MPKNTLIIIYASSLQLITGLFLLVFSSQFNIARLGVYYLVFHDHYVGPLLMILSSLLGMYGIFTKVKSRLYPLFFFPQQFFLFLSAGSAINYIFAQHYADGVLRPWQFIFLDQLPSLIAASLYLIALFEYTLKRKDEKQYGW